MPCITIRQRLGVVRPARGAEGCASPKPQLTPTVILSEGWGHGRERRIAALTVRLRDDSCADRDATMMNPGWKDLAVDWYAMPPAPEPAKKS
jgi:hypothetical protein